MSSETSELPEPGSSTMQKWWLLVVTDSLLQGTEVPICLRRCAGISGLGYYGEAAKACPVLILLPPPLLLFHVGINNTARGDPGHTKCDFVALDAMAVSMGLRPLQGHSLLSLKGHGGWGKFLRSGRKRPLSQRRRNWGTAGQSSSP